MAWCGVAASGLVSVLQTNVRARCQERAKSDLSARVSNATGGTRGARAARKLDTAAGRYRPVHWDPVDIGREPAVSAVTESRLVWRLATDVSDTSGARRDAGRRGRVT